MYEVERHFIPNTTCQIASDSHSQRAKNFRGPSKKGKCQGMHNSCTPWQMSVTTKFTINFAPKTVQLVMSDLTSYGGLTHPWCDFCA